MRPISVAPVGTVDLVWLTEAKMAIEETFRIPATLSDGITDNAFAYDRTRHQYASTALLQRLLDWYPGRIIGVTAGDLYIPMLTYVFGQAQVGGRAAIVSTARLAQQFYGLPADQRLQELRLRKEVLHEIGHTLTLTHCSCPGCVMSLATTISHVDRKEAKFCPSCFAIACEHLDGPEGKLS